MSLCQYRSEFLVILRKTKNGEDTQRDRILIHHSAFTLCCVYTTTTSTVESLQSATAHRTWKNFGGGGELLGGGSLWLL